MRALIYKGVQKVELQEIPMPVCGPDDVIVRNVRAGICGTDVSAYLLGGLYGGIFPESELGHEFGHEMVGFIHETGGNVAALEKGMRVFVNPLTRIPDPSQACMANAFSEYVLVQKAQIDHNIYILPDSLSFDDAVLIEPFSVGTHGKNTAQTKPEDKVIIYGAGTIGLCALSALIAQGNTKIVVVDIDDKRLETVKVLGGIGFNPKSGELYPFLKEHLGEITNIYRTPVIDVDVVIDCAGVPSIPVDFLNYSKPGAKLSCVGMHKKELMLDFSIIMSKHNIILGSRGYTMEDIREVIHNLAGKKSSVYKIITHIFRMEEGTEAFLTASDPSQAIKVILDLE
jgi:L-iditol 2-dehydrogenase